MSTQSGGPDNPWAQPGDPNQSDPQSAPPTQPAPSGYGTPSSPSYGKYGQGTAVPSAPPPPPAPPAWGQPGQSGQPSQPGPGQPPPGQPTWGQPGYSGQPAWLNTARAFRPAGGLGIAVIVLSVLYTVASWLSAIFVSGDSQSFAEALEANPNATVSFSTAEIISLAASPVLIGVWVVTSIWLARAMDNALILRPHGQRRTRGWAWFGWVLPIVYLWFPKQILDDTVAATAPAAGDTKPFRTNLYWSLWVTALVIGAIGSGASFAGVDGSVSRVILLLEAAVLTAALGPWLLLVRRLSAIQDRLAAKGAVDPAQQPPRPTLEG
jgi:uncharacterized protein DUF4328